MNIHDLVTDDNFRTAWYSNPSVKKPWIAIELGESQELNAVVITEVKDGQLRRYNIECRINGKWHKVFDGTAPTNRRVKLHRFDRQYADAVRINVDEADADLAIAQIGIYNEF